MLEAFKTDLSSLSSIQMIRKYILNGSCHILNDDQHFRLKEQICEHFRVEYNSVILVGSGKLGFSIKADKRFLPFGEDSDIDVAVVSTELFQKVWEEVYLYKKSGAYWPNSGTFFRYLSEGWIRPDKLPSSDYFAFTATWWNFFNDITASKRYGAFKVRAGLYHSMFFLQEYQKICIEQCIEELN